MSAFHTARKFSEDRGAFHGSIREFLSDKESYSCAYESSCPDADFITAYTLWLRNTLPQDLPDERTKFCLRLLARRLHPIFFDELPSRCPAAD